MVFFALEKLVSLVSFHLLVVVQSLGGVWLFVTPWTTACQASLSFTISEFAQTHVESMMPFNHLIFCRPLLLLPSIFSSIKVFSNESALQIRRPKYWSFSFSPSSEYLRLVSFTTDFFDLCSSRDSQPYHNSKASILWCSAFFMVQLSHPYMTAGKTIALTIQTFAGKMFLLFKTLSSLS